MIKKSSKNILSRKIKLYLKPKQETILENWQDVGRQLWNMANQQYLESYKKWSQRPGIAFLPRPDAFRQAGELTTLRRECPEFAEMSQAAQCAVLKSLEDGWERYFKRHERPNLLIGKPKYKHKKKPVAINFPGREAKVSKGYINIPKIGKVKFRGMDRINDFTPIRVAITKEPDAWYASIMFETEMPLPAPDGTIVGIDRGIALAMADSDGITIANPRFGQQMKSKIRKINRGVSRQELIQKTKRTKDALGRNLGKEISYYSSKRLTKRKKKLAILERKIARRRNGWQHQITTQYVRNYQTIIIEELKIKNMTKSAKGTNDKPGKNVKQKSG